MQKIVDIVATIPELADAFCHLTDEEQAQFFAEVWTRMREVCAEAKAKNPRGINFGADWQLYSAGKVARDAGLYEPAAECLMSLSAPLYVQMLMRERS